MDTRHFWSNLANRLLLCKKRPILPVLHPSKPKNTPISLPKYSKSGPQILWRASYLQKNPWINPGYLIIQVKGRYHQKNAQSGFF
jgi:hypothetical protein